MLSLSLIYTYTHVLLISGCLSTRMSDIWKYRCTIVHPSIIKTTIDISVKAHKHTILNLCCRVNIVSISSFERWSIISLVHESAFTAMTQFFKRLIQLVYLDKFSHMDYFLILYMQTRTRTYVQISAKFFLVKVANLRGPNDRKTKPKD